jgi:uncharacterized protein DUF4160
MPTIATIGPYRFHFYSSDSREPAHVHVERDSSRAKFWLDPVTLEWSKKFPERELREIERLVIEHRSEWIEKWNVYFKR